MTSSKRALALLLSLSLFAPSLAFAQSAQDLETARELNREGKQLRADGKVVEALAKFRAAHDLGHTPVTGIELARTHAMLNQLVEAREVCLGIARMPVASDETERSAKAREEAAKLAEDLKPRIPSIRVHVSGVPQGKQATVHVDGELLPAAMIDEPYKVNPGKHEIAASVDGGAQVKASVDVREAESRDVPLEIPNVVVVPPPPPVSYVPPITTPRTPPTKDAPKPAPSSKLATVGFAIGGAGIVVGTLAGLTALSRKSTLDAGCKNKQCEPGYYDDLDAAQTWGTFSTIAFGVGAAGVAVGIYALIVDKNEKSEKKERVAPYVGAGTVGVHGAF
jgi:hypothetical protein